MLLGVVGHASSSDGQQTDAAEARYIQDLISRLKFKVNLTKFSNSVALGLKELLSRVETIELMHAIYYESLSVIVANLEVDEEEKELLEEVKKTFKLDHQKIVQMHTKYYLDSGLREALDSLKDIPITESRNGCLHRYQEVLVESELVPVAEMAPIAIQCLERIDTIKLPPETPTDVRMAVFLGGKCHAIRWIFDEDEKAFLMQTMSEFKLSGKDLKNHPKIMKECGL